MVLKLAVLDDLPELQAVYRALIRHMGENGIQIWDEDYPACFFARDIEQKRLYLLEDDHKIAAAFALCSDHPGAECVAWREPQARALYLNRLGVNVNYLKKGIGSAALYHALARTKELGAAYLRLFVVEHNAPAIRLYVKNGFQQLDGLHAQVIDDDLVLQEYCFEKRIPMES